MSERKLKIVVTGKNKKVAGDICEHLENDKGYITLRCNPAKTALFDLVLAELPKVIIICLGNETWETVKIYNILKDVAKQGGCTIIVVANEEDERIFLKFTELERVLLLSRPVSLFALYEKMEAIEEELRKNKEKDPSAFREYINPDAEKGIRRKRILVVDDDVEQLTHIRDQLEEFYDVSLVRSGDAALKFLLTHRPDLILLDYLMPEKDGPQVLREIRTINNCAAIPVVFLTGVSEKKAVLQTIRDLRPQGYIIKPAKKSEIVAKIIDVLG
ncbi:MAG: response regulator [Lachnospiraceae bacterium]|nr:response regulator [Lachnospiraceae bacterium]